MKEVTLYTDGACSGNPGPGGYCAILVYRDQEKVLCGAEKQTTNNRMELCAVIEGLCALREPCLVEVVSDSKYVVDAIEKEWLSSWEKKGWRKSDRSPVQNVDLWQKLLPLLQTHRVHFTWIRGHAGHPYNERCDAIAVREYQKYLP